MAGRLRSLAPALMTYTSTSGAPLRPGIQRFSKAGVGVGTPVIQGLRDCCRFVALTDKVPADLISDSNGPRNSGSTRDRGSILATDGVEDDDHASDGVTAPAAAAIPLPINNSRLFMCAICGLKMVDDSESEAVVAVQGRLDTPASQRGRTIFDLTSAICTRATGRLSRETPQKKSNRCLINHHVPR